MDIVTDQTDAMIVKVGSGYQALVCTSLCQQEPAAPCSVTRLSSGLHPIFPLD